MSRRSASFAVSVAIVLSGLTTPAGAANLSTSRTAEKEQRLAQPFLDSLGQQIVEVDDGADLPTEPALQARLALRPKHDWNGVCEATIVRLVIADASKDDQPDTKSIKGIKDVDTQKLYKIRGNPDQNADQDDQAFTALCAKDRPFRDSYFSAPDGRTAQNAGQIVAEAHRLVLHRDGRFKISCEVKADCEAGPKVLLSGILDRLLMVDEVTPCAADRLCLTLTFWISGHCARSWSVVARHKEAGPKGWGLVEVETLRVNREGCAGLPMSQRSDFNP